MRPGPGFKPLLRRSRMSFPAGLLACFCCVIFLVLVSMFLGCLLRSIRSRFESPSHPKRDFAGVLSSSLLNKLLAAISLRFESPSRRRRHKFFFVLLDDIFGPPRLEPPSPRAICPRSSQLSLAVTVPFSQMETSFGCTGWESNPRDTCLAKVPAHVWSSALDPSTVPAPLLCLSERRSVAYARALSDQQLHVPKHFWYVHETLTRSIFVRFGHILHQNDLKFGADSRYVVRFDI